MRQRQWNKDKFNYHKRLPYDKRPAKNAISSFLVFSLLQFQKNFSKKILWKEAIIFFNLF